MSICHHCATWVYVGNCLDSTETEEEAIEIIKVFRHC